MNILLDTNIISALLKGDVSIASRIDEASTVNIPIIVLGELYYGAYFSTHIQKNIKAINMLINQYSVIAVDEETSIEYGLIKSLLRKKGTPIPENDIWIAAIAMKNELTLITRDKHFKEIEGIAIEKW